MQKWPEPAQKLPCEVSTLLTGIVLILLAGSALALFSDEQNSKSIAIVIVISLATYAAAVLSWAFWTRLR